MRSRYSITLGAFLILFAASSAFSQTIPRGEIGAGYQFMRDFDFADVLRDTGLSENFSTGFSIYGAGMLTERLAAAGEFGYSRWTTGDVVFEDELLLDASANIYTVLGGPRLYARFARATAFGQVLLGAARSTGDVFAIGEQLNVADTSFAVQPGGGVDLHLTDRVGVRAQADLRRIFYEGDGSNQFRFVTGVVLWFGNR